MQYTFYGGLSESKRREYKEWLQWLFTTRCSISSRRVLNILSEVQSTNQSVSRRVFLIQVELNLQTYQKELSKELWKDRLQCLIWKIFPLQAIILGFQINTGDSPCRSTICTGGPIVLWAQSSYLYKYDKPAELLGWQYKVDHAEL